MVGVRALRDKLGEYLAMAQKEEVVVARHGRPFVRLLGVSGSEFKGLEKAKVSRKSKGGTSARAE